MLKIIFFYPFFLEFVVRTIKYTNCHPFTPSKLATHSPLPPPPLGATSARADNSSVRDRSRVRHGPGECVSWGVSLGVSASECAIAAQVSVREFRKFRWYD